MHNIMKNELTNDEENFLEGKGKGGKGTWETSWLTATYLIIKQ